MTTMTTLIDPNNAFNGFLSAQLTPGLVKKQKDLLEKRRELDIITDDITRRIRTIVDKFPSEFQDHNTDKSNYMTFWIADERYDHKIEEKTPEEFKEEIYPLIKLYREEINNFWNVNEEINSLKNEEYFSNVYYKIQPWELTSDQYIKSLTKGGNISSPEYNPVSVEKIKEYGHKKPLEKIKSLEINNEEIGIYKSKEIHHNYSGEDFEDPSLYAMNEEGDTIAYMSPAIFGGVELIVAEEYQKMGIGTAMSRLFRELTDKYYPSGGFTMGGYAMTKKIHKQLVDEAIQRGENVPQKVLREYGYM